MRETMHVEVDGLRIAAVTDGPKQATGKPLLAALHGGGYQGSYFDIAAGPAGSFLDVAAALGHPVLSFDRPGYGASDPVPTAENSFAHQAELLTPAIAELADRLSAPGVVLVGHSIGGMIALMIAAGQPAFPLIGVSVTGMGAVIPSGGAAEGLAEAAGASGEDTIALPPEQSDQVMMGPDWTFDPAVRDAAHVSYAPQTPVVELVMAPRWASEILSGLAPRVTVPVHNELPEFDALWDSSADSLERFRMLFTAAPWVDVRLARGTGHSLDHHRLGPALHLRQLAFAEECALLATR